MMDAYTIGLITGGVGLVSMAIVGMGHHHGDGSAGHHGAHDGMGHAGHGHAVDAHSGHGHDGGAHQGEGHSVSGTHAAVPHGHMPGWLSALFTPRALFSALTGFGVVGLAVAALGEPIRFVLALAGGLIFEIAMTGPISRVLMRFASRPALTLESCVMDEVRATAGFDADGRGLVTAELDGQIVQVLATLRPQDLAAGARVRQGDRLRVEEVDGARQRFIVSVL